MELNKVDINRLSKKYILQGILMILVLTIIATLLMHDDTKGGNVLVPIGICILYSLCIEVSEALIWKRVAMKAPDSQSTFFMGVSGFRMLAAIAILFFYYLLSDHGMMLEFLVLFIVFYFALLIHHSLFFTKLGKL